MKAKYMILMNSLSKYIVAACFSLLACTTIFAAAVKYDTLDKIPQESRNLFKGDDLLNTRVDVNNRYKGIVGTPNEGVIQSYKDAFDKAFDEYVDAKIAAKLAETDPTKIGEPLKELRHKLDLAAQNLDTAYFNFNMEYRTSTGKQ